MPVLNSRFYERLRSDGGAALAEFTLVLPVLLLVLFGIIDFGKALNYYIDQTHIASTTARYAAVNVNPGGGPLQAWAKTLADSAELRNGGTSSVASPGVRVCITPGSTSRSAGRRRDALDVPPDPVHRRQHRRRLDDHQGALDHAHGDGCHQLRSANNRRAADARAAPHDTRNAAARSCSSRCSSPS